GEPDARQPHPGPYRFRRAGSLSSAHLDPRLPGAQAVVDAHRFEAQSGGLGAETEIDDPITHLGVSGRHRLSVGTRVLLFEAGPAGNLSCYRLSRHPARRLDVLLDPQYVLSQAGPGAEDAGPQPFGTHRSVLDVR